jgi:hypothetical protein
MDLADLWAQHRKFIISVAGALLALLIGRGWLRHELPWDEVQRDAEKMAGQMQRAEEIPDAAVRALEADVAGLRARYAELAGAMRFELDEAFKLPPNEPNPRSYFFNQLRRTQRVLVDAAEKQDIRVPDALGLKDMAPTDPDEIRRTLLALDVIQLVLAEAIGAGIRRIETIRIEDEQRGRAKAAGFLRELHVDFDVVGGERALRSMIAGLVDGPAAGRSPYLAVDKARLRPVKGEEGMLALRLTLAALEIERGEDEEEGP